MSLNFIRQPRPFFLGILLLFTGASFSWAGSVGTTTADILKINMGARPAAMGGAYTAMGDDAYSVDYNPAGLALVKSSELVLLHLDSLADISYEKLIFATAWGSDKVWTVNMVYRHEDPIDNNPGVEDPVNADDLLGSLSFSMKLSDSIRAGATLKYLKSNLAAYSASAVGGDIGVQIDKLPYGIRAGLSIQNVGTGMTFAQEGAAAPSNAPADPLPMFIRFGIGTHQVFEGNRDFDAGVEVFKPSDQDIKLGLGAEFWIFPKLFAIRGGYKMESIGAPNGNAFNDYTLGCSLTRDFDGDDFSIDIAYNPADFSTTTQDTFFFALNFQFNQFRIF